MVRSDVAVLTPTYYIVVPTHLLAAPIAISLRACHGQLGSKDDQIYSQLKDNPSASISHSEHLWIFFFSKLRRT